MKGMMIYSDPGERLHIWVDSPLPKQMNIGFGTVFFISGWYWDPDQSVSHMEISLNGVAVTYGQNHVYRPDAIRFVSLKREKIGFSSIHGFWFLVPLHPGLPSLNEIHLCYSKDERTTKKIYLGSVEIIKTLTDKNRDIRIISGLSYHITLENQWPLVVIGLASYNPDIHMFLRQITSIKQQKYPNWYCIICDDNSDDTIQEQMIKIIRDDNRFIFYPNEENIGFYLNFERIISMISPEVPFIALSDQDDYWYPDKLMRLFQEFDGDTILVHSDMRIVSSSGSSLSDSFWNGKTYEYSLVHQLLNNEITGASCMFRGSLCQYLLPFPPNIGQALREPGVTFHDHWIGSVAMAIGGIKRINSPLYDYYQHDANVAGYTVSLHWFKKIEKKLSELSHSGLLIFLIHSYRKYVTHSVQRVCMTMIIMLRISPLIPQKKDQLLLVNKLIFSGYMMAEFLVMNVNKKGIIGDIEKTILIGFFSGMIIPLVIKVHFWRKRIFLNNS